ncbi:uncharacterized protein LOC129942820 [Eupeodes corollae]|uniref:uncharacterized protein LOC129942820 n=1 Tax=Eupeodes corollae TaxID=290404 RepID=UPI0024927DAE|nr:uncharacterized protein LOC129942820 [Eupeodes corollae]
MRCKSCQILGHTAKRCNNSKQCEVCSLPPHEPTECTRTMCANCSEAHPSSSKTCPKYLQNKKILTIKTRNKCSMGEAKRTYSQMFPTQPILRTQTYSLRARESLKISEKTLPSIETHNLDANKAKDNHNINTSTNNYKTTVQRNSSPKPPKMPTSEALASASPLPINLPIIQKQPHRPLPPTPKTISILNQTNQPPETSTTQNSSISIISNNLIQKESYFISTSDTDDNE